MARTRLAFEVRRTQRLTDHLIRVYLGGAGFEGFQPNGFTDAYVKLLFPGPDGDTMRTYTVSSIDTAAREIAIDFVYHGDEGVAGPWAAAAQPGDAIELFGPGGAYSPDPEADWHLLAGDEAALPAIAAACAALPSDAVGRVFVEIGGPADEFDFPKPAGVRFDWVYRGDRAPGEALAEAVRAEQWREGRVHVFIHGEADRVMHDLRRYIRTERGVPAASASISGYWRRGRTEEGFREWKRDLSEKEAATSGAS
ncbi:siderophore-interacting protein [Nocardia nova]|uniref:siderophore-interacting protein n=1 Tax=Nocardia nova TaxID=37330 RepID=UPI0033DD0D30